MSVPSSQISVQQRQFLWPTQDRMTMSPTAGSKLLAEVDLVAPKALGRRESSPSLALLMVPLAQPAAFVAVRMVGRMAYKKFLNTYFSSAIAISSKAASMKSKASCASLHIPHAFRHVAIFFNVFFSSLLNKTCLFRSPFIPWS